jgi:large subunit ribosomal protein L22
MEATAHQKFIIMSARKIRRVVNAIRGKSVTQAYQMLRLMPYAASSVVLKKLIDAVSNAQVLYALPAEKLMVSRAFVDEGPAYTRFKPRAQGRIYRREKQTAHLTICVKAV